MQNVNYWYYSQVRTIILHTLRLFSNFKISEGKDADGNPKLRRIPIVYMSTDKSVVYMLNNASDTVLESCPKMVLTISEIKANERLQSGSPYYEFDTSFTEKKFDEEIGNYVDEVGDSYTIRRANPVPLGITFKLYILTSMQDQKFQLFEQIRALFTPTLELQTSENPLDWTRVTAITLTGINWSSKGTTNLDSSTLDSMDMTFEVNTNLDMPSLIQRERMIEEIVNNIGDGSGYEDIVSWSLEDTSRTFYSPSNNRIKLFVDENNNQCVQLLPSEKCKTWGELIKLYGISYSPTDKDIKINCLTSDNVDKRNDIKGSVIFTNLDSDIAQYNIDETTLPKDEYCIFVDAIIDPSSFEPAQENETTYLIDKEIGTGTKWWGELLNESGEKIDKIDENCIIKKLNGNWTLFIDPKKYSGTIILKDKSEPKYIYTYNSDYEIWVDYINKTYQVGFWRISCKTK